MVTVPVRGQKPYDEILNAALQQLEDDRVAGDDALDARLDVIEASWVRATDQDGDPIAGQSARIVFDAYGDVEDIILEDN